MPVFGDKYRKTRNDVWCPVCKKSPGDIKKDAQERKGRKHHGAWTINTHLKQMHQVEMVAGCFECKQQTPSVINGKTQVDDIVKHLDKTHHKGPERIIWLLHPVTHIANYKADPDRTVILPDNLLDIDQEFKDWKAAWCKEPESDDDSSVSTSAHGSRTGSPKVKAKSKSHRTKGKGKVVTVESTEPEHEQEQEQEVDPGKDQKES